MSDISPLPILPHGDPCVVVIFGASGDLTHRKLLPALFHLACSGCLASDFRVIGVALDPLTPDAFRDKMCEGVKHSHEICVFSDADWQMFAPKLEYLAGNFGDAATYDELAERLEQMGAPEDSTSMNSFRTITANN